MMKTFTQKRFFQVSLLLVFFMSSFLFVSADEETESTSLYGEEDYACAAGLSAQISPLLKNYYTIIDEYTKVDMPSSEQFENTFMVYRFVEDTIRKSYEENVSFSSSNKSVAFASRELSACRQMRDGLIEYARNYLSIFISGSSTSKTTFEFVDGLKIMNEDLKEMSMLFQSTFPGQFTEMSSALPCYAHECLSK